jgi:hypothetical protein
MGHYISVFYLQINKSEVPETIDTWHSSIDVLDKYSKMSGGSELYKTASRNWWHQHALLLICEQLRISGLEFIDSEIACITHADLEGIEIALTSVLKRLSIGFPDFGPIEEQSGSVWHLVNYFESGEIKQYTQETIRQAFDESIVTRDASCGVDSGYESLVTFFSFIKSLHYCVKEAMNGNKFLLYVQPQP